MIAFLEQTKTTVNKNQYCICPGRHRAGVDWEGCEGPFYGGGSVLYFDKVWFIRLCVFVKIQRMVHSRFVHFLVGKFYLKKNFLNKH